MHFLCVCVAVAYVAFAVLVGYVWFDVWFVVEFC